MTTKVVRARLPIRPPSSSRSDLVKIILSRKGFDSAFGGVPSPILPSGEMVSLPIPERPGAVTAASRTYGQIQAGSAGSVGRLVADLTRGRVQPDDPAHLDPDLHPASAHSRPPGWRPAFGQTGAAETHLQNQGVGPGDVFLFYGWFREVTQNTAGRFGYRPEAPDRHVIFGWLQIAQRLPIAPLSALPAWTAGHPHHKPVPYGRTDCVYLATDRLRLPLPGHDGLPGGGIWRSFHPDRILSAPGRTRSWWQLPAWFHPPAGGGPALSYHSRPARWTRTDTGAVLLNTAKQGQEFVLDCEHYPEALAWLAGMLASASSSS